MPYLIDKLKESGPIDFIFISRSELLTKKKKAGGTYQVYEYTFTIRDNGKEHKENIFPNVHDRELCDAEFGDICHAEVSGNFVNWSVVKPEGDRTPVPARTNYQEVKSERKFSESQANYDRDDKIKQVMISLAGLTQAHISAGRTNKEALDLAIEARNAIIAKAISIVESHS